jgi:dTDP-4-dehydrorhamnose 3,5-epimerase
MIINGVETKKLNIHADARGYFLENLRASDLMFTQFGQWSESLMHTGVIKAWHVHTKQTDYWRVVAGSIRAVLCDLRGESSTHMVINEYFLGGGYEPVLLKIPPGVAHGCKVLQGPAVLIYLTDREYNPEDEGRLPHDDPMIGYDWLYEEIR